MLVIFWVASSKMILTFLENEAKKAVNKCRGILQYGLFNTVNIFTQSVGWSSIGGSWCTPEPSVCILNTATPPPQATMVPAGGTHPSWIPSCIQVGQLNMTGCIMTWERKRGGSFHLLIRSADYAGPLVKLLQGNRRMAALHTQPPMETLLLSDGQSSPLPSAGEDDQPQLEYLHVKSIDVSRP